jgi:GT2 family glycosyltransferase
LTAAPLVSVIVATHARPDGLARCLASLAAQTLAPHAFEVVVVDDGTPQPVTVASSLSAGGTPVVLCRQVNAGPASARNRGIAQARGRYVAFIDDDCAAEPRWLATLVDVLETHQGAGAGGVVVNTLATNPYSEASQAIVSFICEYYNADPLDGRFFTSNNLAFPREALCAAGAFNARFQKAAAEDRELCHRWRDLGHRIVAAREAVVYHAHDLQFRQFWAQHYNYGTGARQFRRALVASRGEPVRVEPLTFYWRLLTWPVRRRGLAGLRHAALIVIAQAANAAGFFREAARERQAPQVTSRRALR